MIHESNQRRDLLESEENKKYLDNKQIELIKNYTIIEHNEKEIIAFNISNKNTLNILSLNILEHKYFLSLNPLDISRIQHKDGNPNFIQFYDKINNFLGAIYIYENIIENYIKITNLINEYSNKNKNSGIKEI